MLNTSSTQPNGARASGEVQSSNSSNRAQSLWSFPLSAGERGLLLALIWGEPLIQAEQRLEMPPGEAHQVLSRLQQRAGVPTRRALIARAVAYRWAV